MPTANNSDVLYKWIDEHGTVHFSNVQPDAPPPSTSHSESQPQPEKQFQAETQPQQHKYPWISPQPTKQATLTQQTPQDPAKPQGTSLTPIVLLIVMAVLFRLFQDYAEKERRKKKVKDLRPEKSRTAPTVERDQEESEPIIGPPTMPTQKSKPPPTTWSVDFIQSLEWREFEKLCARILEEKGFLAKLNEPGPDGGVDITIYHPNTPDKPYAIAQCKAHRKEIKVDTVRALKGVMASHEITKGFFFASGGFYKKASEFGTEQNIELYSSERLLQELQAFPREKQESMLKNIATTDYTTPTCVNCGIKMIRRDSENKKEFWGCPNFPRCKNILELRWADRTT